MQAGRHLRNDALTAPRHSAAMLDFTPGRLGREERQRGLAQLVQDHPAQALPLLTGLCAAFPADQDLGIALAEAEWQVNGPAAAIPHLRRVLSLADRPRLRCRLGLALLLDGRAAAAVAELHGADEAPELAHLGMALLAVGDAAAAVAALLRARQLDPADPAAAFHLGQAHRDAGCIAPALAALRDAVRLGPQQPHLHAALGDALLASGNPGEARTSLQQALRLDGSLAVAWSRLGDVERLSGCPPDAVACYRQAVTLQPADPDLRAQLGNALLATGDVAGAHAELGASMTARWRSPPATGRIRVGILAAPGAANTPTDYIIDRSRFTAEPVFLLDGFDYPAARLADRYDVLFNAISDPDAAGPALAQAANLARAIGRPVLNPPAAIADTTRDRMANRLAGIEGLHVPRTRRVWAAADWDGCEVLVRPAGSHGGSGMTLARTAADCAAALHALPDGESYVTEFVDVRAPDGLYRKLRVVFVGGDLVPVHLAIGDHWLSHYFRTGMIDHPARRAEEAAFLADPRSYVGERAYAALQQVPERVGLDFFGLDGAIGQDGRLVLFECNAAMLVRHADRHAAFDYKRNAAQRIRDRLSRILASVEENTVCAGPHPNPLPCFTGEGRGEGRCLRALGDYPRRRGR